MYILDLVGGALMAHCVRVISVDEPVLLMAKRRSFPSTSHPSTYAEHMEERTAEVMLQHDEGIDLGGTASRYNRPSRPDSAASYRPSFHMHTVQYCHSPAGTLPGVENAAFSRLRSDARRDTHAADRLSVESIYRHVLYLT